jgi:hypothetical protein
MQEEMEKIVLAYRVKNEDYYLEPGVCSGAVCRGRSRARFPMWLFAFFVDLLRPPWGRLSL